MPDVSIIFTLAAIDFSMALFVTGKFPVELLPVVLWFACENAKAYS